LRHSDLVDQVAGGEIPFEHDHRVLARAERLRDTALDDGTPAGLQALAVPPHIGVTDGIDLTPFADGAKEYLVFFGEHAQELGQAEVRRIPIGSRICIGNDK
jgi:hypothetical protein